MDKKNQITQISLLGFAFLVCTLTLIFAGLKSNPLLQICLVSLSALALILKVLLPYNKLGQLVTGLVIGVSFIGASLVAAVYVAVWISELFFPPDPARPIMPMGEFYLGCLGGVILAVLIILLYFRKLHRSSTVETVFLLAMIVTLLSAWPQNN